MSHCLVSTIATVTQYETSVRIVFLTQVVYFTHVTIMDVIFHDVMLLYQRYWDLAVVISSVSID